jgi:hypothetical protein
VRKESGLIGDRSYLHKKCDREHDVIERRESANVPDFYVLVKRGQARMLSVLIDG